MCKIISYPSLPRDKSIFITICAGADARMEIIMKLVTREQIREIDRLAIELGIPGAVLMENAAAAAARELRGVQSVRIFCGGGQNGGDGYAMARHLFNMGADVELVAVSEKLSGDALQNYIAAKNIGINITPFADLQDKKYEVLVDALLGTGLRGEVCGVYKAAVDEINSSGAYVLAVDIPSGIDADTGEVLGCAVIADKTVTFAYPKLGLYSPLSADYTGEIVTADISVPINLEYLDTINRYKLTSEDVGKFFAPVSRAAHKGDMGRALIIGGSAGMAGAVILAANAAERGGAGLITCAVPAKLMDVMMARLTGAMCVEIGDDLDERIRHADSVLVGNGMGASEGTLEIVKKVLKNARGRVVIDADGLNVLQGKPHLLKETDADVSVTPHPMEMARLTGASVEDTIKNRVLTAEGFTRDFGVCVALKGAYTVVSSLGLATYINSTGNAGMAKGGSGDVLAGLVTGLAAKGLSAAGSVLAGVYSHGAAGDLAVNKIGEFSLRAEDICEYIPEAIRIIKSKK